MDVTVARAGAQGLPTHSLRHSYASGLIVEGRDVVTVQRVLGQSSPSTTLNTYRHLWPTAEDGIRAAAAVLWGSSVPHFRFFFRLARPPMEKVTA